MSRKNIIDRVLNRPRESRGPRPFGAPPPTYTRKACVPLASQAFLEAAKPYPVSDGYLRIARLCTLDRVCIKYRPMSATIQTVRLKYDFCC